MRRQILLPALAVFLLTAAPALAHFGERTDSLWGFVSRSDVIVIGTVLDSHRFEEKGHTTLPGAIHLGVEETLLGNVRPAEIGIRIEGVHQPRYREGERVLVFAERRDGGLRSLQSRSEKVAAVPTADPLITAIRRYIEVRTRADANKRLRALKDLTLDLLRSPEPRLHQDAVFDLSRKGLLDQHLSDDEIGVLGSLALAAPTPLVVREGVAHKLGVLLTAGRDAALEPLSKLALQPENPVVRVGALNALRASRRDQVASTMFAALDDGSAHVRRAAVEGLAALGGDQAVPALTGLTRDPDQRVRFEAVRALVRLDTESARAAVAALAKHENPDLRRSVALVLSERRDAHPEKTAADSKGDWRR